MMDILNVIYQIGLKHIKFSDHGGVIAYEQSLSFYDNHRVAIFNCHNCKIEYFNHKINHKVNSYHSLNSMISQVMDTEVGEIFYCADPNFCTLIEDRVKNAFSD